MPPLLLTGLVSVGLLDEDLTLDGEEHLRERADLGLPAGAGPRAEQREAHLAVSVQVRIHCGGQWGCGRWRPQREQADRVGAHALRTRPPAVVRNWTLGGTAGYAAGRKTSKSHTPFW